MRPPRDFKFETPQRDDTKASSENIYVYDVYQSSVFMVIGDTWKTLNYVSVCAFCTKKSQKHFYVGSFLQFCVRRTTVQGHNGDINIVERAATTEGRV